MEALSACFAHQFSLLFCWIPRIIKEGLIYSTKKCIFLVRCLLSHTVYRFNDFITCSSSIFLLQLAESALHSNTHLSIKQISYLLIIWRIFNLLLLAGFALLMPLLQCCCKAYKIVCDFVKRINCNRSVDDETIFIIIIGVCVPLRRQRSDVTTGLWLQSTQWGNGVFALLPRCKGGPGSHRLRWWNGWRVLAKSSVPGGLLDESGVL